MTTASFFGEQLIASAHEHGIKVLSGLGTYGAPNSSPISASRKENAPWDVQNSRFAGSICRN
jgi:hypothetical protein